MSKAAHLPTLSHKDIARFWSKVRKTDHCWEWVGTRHGEGYGYIGFGGRAGRNYLAHRVAYELLVGPIPDGLGLDHLCRNRPCVRPEHLEPVTDKVNILRGVGPSAQHAKATHCPRGHEYTPENTYPHPRGRDCLTCRHTWAARAQARRVA